MVGDPLIAQFPRLAIGGYRVASVATSNYNCIAWAAGRTDRWWWPSRDAFWPPDIPAQETLDAFVRAYETLGFTPCADAALEPGFEKIAIYANPGGSPKHAARQLSSGKWTSKLGRAVDIEHVDPGALEGQLYGSTCLFLKRRRRRWDAAMRWLVGWLRRLARMLAP